MCVTRWTTAGAEDERQDAGLIELLGQEDRAEHEEPGLPREQPAGEGPAGHGDNAAAQAADDPERRRVIVGPAGAADEQPGPPHPRPGPDEREEHRKSLAARNLAERFHGGLQQLG